MPPTTADGVLFCGACGDEAAMLYEDERGPCCHNLPNPWRCGPDGLYNNTSLADDFVSEDDEDEDEREVAHCYNCGSERWIVSATQRAHSNEDGGDVIYFDYDEFEEISARCAECSTPMPRDYLLEGTG